MRHEDITEVSDPHQLTIDEPPHGAPEIRVLKGTPTDEEVAALVTVLAAAAGGAPTPGPQELNLWGHPVDKLRYGVTSWQRVTLLERTHVRR
ncbi:MAG: acyl-CoA carboxylase subunit epsilon [Mycobacterium sp.]|nr:acyl-CoA carboxylase subunit epsilon [Mycobacterium sp.]